MSDYDVGYGKPPKHTRFQKGQSGNPKGRPKGTLNLSTSLVKALSKTVTVTENGREAKMSKFELMLETNVNKAIKADSRAFANIFSLMARMNIGAPEPEMAESFTVDDNAALDRFLADCRQSESIDDDAS